MTADEYNYKFCGEPPAEVDQTIQIGPNFYKVTSREPLYYEFRNLISGVDVGFQSARYNIQNLIPGLDFVYYINSWGINGGIKAQVMYPADNLRNAPGAAPTQRLNDLQASMTHPFTMRMAIVGGDSVGLDILADFPGVLAGVWFYGWKIKVQPLKTAPKEGTPVVILDDVRALY